MSARASKHDQRALCALFALVTTDLPRSRFSVTSGNAPRFAWATASVASRVGSCPTVCGGRRCGRCPCPTPLPLGSVASISIKGEGCARHPPPFALAALACAAASGVALDADSSQYTVANGDAHELARSADCRQSPNSQSSPLATTHCNLVARSVAKLR